MLFCTVLISFDCCVFRGISERFRLGFPLRMCRLALELEAPILESSDLSHPVRAFAMLHRMARYELPLADQLTSDSEHLRGTAFEALLFLEAITLLYIHFKFSHLWAIEVNYCSHTNSLRFKRLPKSQSSNSVQYSVHTNLHKIERTLVHIGTFSNSFSSKTRSIQ